MMPLLKDSLSHSTTKIGPTCYREGEICTDLKSTARKLTPFVVNHEDEDSKEAIVMSLILPQLYLLVILQRTKIA